jgi:predicted short-subunit dehydrogenase-like oxidoreductase (DUF2520 family)
MKTPIIIIGWGTAAQFFAKRFSHLHIVAIATREPTDTGKIKNIRLKEIKSSFEGIILLCVNDDSIAEVAHSLLDSNGLICHCSGAVDIDVLEDLQSYGVFYPFQSLAKVDANEEIPLLIECEHFLDSKLLHQLAVEGKFKATDVKSEQRKHLHLAATVANNFTHHLLSSAKNYLLNNKVDHKLLEPLLTKTLNLFLEEEGNGFDLQTGPAKRGDQDTINAHLSMMKDDKDFTKLYSKMTEVIREKYNGKG